jgi:hypothetical protein
MTGNQNHFVVFVTFVAFVPEREPSAVDTYGS